MAIVVNMGALDRPVWSALTTGDRRFAEGGSLALRFPPDIAPFGATADDSPEAFAALRDLISPEGRVALVTVDKLNAHRGRGYAGFLVAWLVRKLREDGTTPFLHVFTDNPAIALYDRLGFTRRKTLPSRCWRAHPGIDRSELPALQTGARRRIGWELPGLASTEDWRPDKGGSDARGRDDHRR